MASWVEDVYRHCPPWLQNVGVTVYGWSWRRRRMGGRFLEHVDAFRRREGFGRHDWQCYQTTRLREMLRWCLREVPHYRRAWARAGLHASDIESFELRDLRCLPMTDKEEIRSAPDAFLAAPTDARRLGAALTSGSTGTPLAVRMSASTCQLWYAAYEARCRRWAGVDHTMSRAMIGGRQVVPRASARPPYWRFNAVERQVYFSAFHIAPSTIEAYVRALNHYRPDYLVGYASAHFFLARMIDEADLEVHSPRAVLTSSEKLTPEMRALLSRVYGCSVFDAYSGVEPCCLASECEHHHLHISPDVGIVELLDAHGNPAAPGEEGEIVATGLLNFEQPLVRYRMGDLAVWSEETCPCGRAMPILRELVGRLEDTVIGLDGRETVRFHGLFVGLKTVQQSQVIQEALDRFTVRVVARNGLAEAERHQIIIRLQDRLGPVQVAVEPVAALEQTERGKYRAVISKVPRSTLRTPN